mgnify:CR=1 FL=1
MEIILIKITFLIQYMLKKVMEGILDNQIKHINLVIKDI